MNWIIIKSCHRGIKYGVGTYIDELSKSLVRLDVNVYVLDMTGDYGSYKFYCHKNGVKTIGLPLAYRSIMGENPQNQINEIIVDLVKGILNEECSVVQSNFLFEHYLIKEFKCKTNYKFIYVNHMAIRESIANLVDFSIYNHIICLSLFAKSRLLKNYPDLTIVPEVIRNGVVIRTIVPLKECEKNDIRKKYNINESSAIILYVGRIDYQKGVEYLINAFKLLNSDCHLLLVGEGDFESILPNCDYYHDKITFTGHLSREKVLQLYRIADIGVNTTINDNAPFTILEMMSMGLPVVASRVGGIVEQIKHQETGFLVDMEQGKHDKVPKVNDISAYIQHLIDFPEVKKIIGISSIESIKHDFNALEMAKKYLKIFVEDNVKI